MTRMALGVPVLGSVHTMTIVAPIVHDLRDFDKRRYIGRRSGKTTYDCFEHVQNCRGASWRHILRS